MRTPTPAPLGALVSTVLLSLLAACASSRAATAAPPPAGAVETLRESYVSAPNPGEELDSLAAWHGADGRPWVIATAKSMHRLVVFDADTGERLREVGGKGAAPGQFKRPNGIAVAGDRVFVVERDNHRVQVLSLPDFRPLGTFGEGELRSPYGLWLDPSADGSVEVYITDNYMLGARFDIVPPLDTLDHRVQRYRVRFDADGQATATPGGHFGATTDADALRVVESIAGDPAHDRLLIADESMPHSTLREYTFAGRATGRHIPGDTFAFEAEGVALWACGKTRGYWVAVDQLSDHTVFHLFDRRSLALVANFRGETTAATDGIALRTTPSERFPHGALFAMHADTSVAAFDLRGLVDALKLDAACR
ncbi:MAG: phytase [Xanthomonadales bacterium]|nr:phytase [Xanthomonadales bacterium]